MSVKSQRKTTTFCSKPKTATCLCFSLVAATRASARREMTKNQIFLIRKTQIRATPKMMIDLLVTTVLKYLNKTKQMSRLRERRVKVIRMRMRSCRVALKHSTLSQTISTRHKRIMKLTRGKFRKILLDFQCMRAPFRR